MQVNTNPGVLEASSSEDRPCSFWAEHLSVFLAVPLVVGLAGLHALLHGWGHLLGGLSVLRGWSLLVLVGGVVAHELLHLLTSAWLGKRPPSSWAFRIGAAMPGLVLWVVPALVGAVIG